MRILTIVTAALLVGLTGCGSDDGSDGLGYIQLYNASPNSPSILLVVGKDDDDNFDEEINSGVGYTKASSYLSYSTDTYDIALSWQDEDDIDDLEIIYETQLTVIDDAIQFVVVSEDITAPEILFFNIDLIDDENDDDDELFNLRFLNMHSWPGGIDIYLSESDETFEQAELLGQYTYTELSDNHKLDQDDYVFYITSAGSSEVLYQSEEVSYQSVSQSMMIIRQNSGPGTSPFSLDRVTDSYSVTEYADANSEAQFRVYNGIVEHDLLLGYEGNFDLHLNGVDESAEVSSLQVGDFSTPILTDFGDYSISLTKPSNNDPIIENHLLTLSVNSDKTIFFYLLEEEVDEDGDGDFDEDGDGIVDEWEITVNSLVVDNSQNGNIYTHQINIINLIDEYSQLDVYFVQNNETIETAENDVTARYGQPRSITLNNNSFQVYIIAEDESSELILTTEELTLNEESEDLFLILEERADSPTGYKMFFAKQKES